MWAAYVTGLGPADVLDHRRAAGDLPVRVHDIWPLERTAEAHRAVEHGVRGRVVLRVAGLWEAR